MSKFLYAAFGLLLCFNTIFCHAEQALIAVAANFKYSAQLLQQQFQHHYPQHQLQFTSASTGVLFNQIQHGAPFHALLAADEKSPQLLEQQGKGVNGTRFTYANGQLVLASKTVAINNTSVLKQQLINHHNRTSLANPTLAPYGLAAKQALVQLSLWQDLKPKLIQGNNVSQVQQFVLTGNATFGFVPYSPVLKQQGLHFFKIPSHWHKPIRQQAMLLQSGQHNAAAKDFLTFLKSDAATTLITQQGYLPASASRD